MNRRRHTCRFVAVVGSALAFNRAISHAGGLVHPQIHLRGEVGGFNYVVACRASLLIRADANQFVPGAFRVLLARLDQENVVGGFGVTQVGWFLPNLTTFSNPIDIGSAAMAYARRQPKLKAVYVVAPARGLMTNVVDFVVRNLPGLDVRMVASPDRVTDLLRSRDPELPPSWFDLPLVP